MIAGKTIIVLTTKGLVEHKDIGEVVLHGTGAILLFGLNGELGRTYGPAGYIYYEIATSTDKVAPYRESDSFIFGRTHF